MEICTNELKGLIDSCTEVIKKEKNEDTFKELIKAGEKIFAAVDGFKTAEGILILTTALEGYFHMVETETSKHFNGHLNYN